MYQTPNLLVVEAATSEDKFALHRVHRPDRVVQIVDECLVWQKERVINLAVRWVPPGCTKIMWVDCDVLFDNDEWVYQTSRMLDDSVVVQPYYQNAKLPPEIRSVDYGLDINRFPYSYEDCGRADGDIHALFKARLGLQPVWHCGFCCAYQRRFLEQIGLYDRCIAGSSDNLTYRGVLGDQFNQFVVFDKYNEASKQFYWKWAKRASTFVDGLVNFVRSSCCYHLFHGSVRNRQYMTRLVYLKDHFRHDTDLEIDEETGLYRLTQEKAYIRKWLKSYLQKRKEK
jgi:hypothetical protein